MKRTKKKMTYKRSIVLGFLVLYITSMFLSTYLLKCKYEEEYSNYLVEQKDECVKEFENSLLYLGGTNEERKANINSYARYMLSTLEGMDEYQQISGAFYDVYGTIDMNGNLLTKTTDIIGTTSYEDNDPESRWMNSEQGQVYIFYPVADYLDEAEMQELMEYKDSLLKHMDYAEVIEQYGMDWEAISEAVYEIHYLSLFFDQSFELLGIEIEEVLIKAISQSAVPEAGIKVVWEWKNDLLVSEDWKPEKEEEEFGGNGEMIFPYLSQGTEARERWLKDQWLQEYPEKLDNISTFMKEEGQDSQTQTSSLVILSKDIDQYSYESYTYFLVLRQTSHPWLAAFDDMKYVYLMGALLTVVCMVTVFYSTQKTYREREKLESMRRDFTNAAAHELKPPLSVIRGFAENLQENTVEEKRDYYLKQIIQQTEQMDDLVKEMIHISKLDSEEFVLRREDISLLQVVKEQMTRFEAQIDEKNLHIIYEVDQEMTVKADLEQMKKVIWNLLSNAIDYNRADGSVWIFSEKDKLVIENTGTSIPEEQLSHVFDMFYTGDESRHERSKHMGLGLYLAKKICDMHGFRLEVANTDVGVKAVISR